MADWIWLLFGVVSRVGLGSRVLDRVPRAPRERRFRGRGDPIGLNGVFFNRDVFDLCVKN